MRNKILFLSLLFLVGFTIYLIVGASNVNAVCNGDPRKATCRWKSCGGGPCRSSKCCNETYCVPLRKRCSRKSTCTRSSQCQTARPTSPVRRACSVRKCRNNGSCRPTTVYTYGSCPSNECWWSSQCKKAKPTSTPAPNCLPNSSLCSGSSQCCSNLCSSQNRIDNNYRCITDPCAANPSSCAAAKCKDSDGGLAPFTAGSVEINGRILRDNCRTSFFTGERKWIQEYYCNAAVEGGVSNITLSCEYGCSAGACNRSQPHPTPTPSCSCGFWSWQGGCGLGGCPSGKRLKERNCIPAGCDIESKCVVDDSCSLIPTQTPIPKSPTPTVPFVPTSTPLPTATPTPFPTLTPLPTPTPTPAGYHPFCPI